MRRHVRESLAGGVSRPSQYRLAGLPLLLDTHVWIWWLTGDAPKFVEGARVLLQRACDVGDLLVSDISCWEVAVRAAKGKLRLPMDTEVRLDWATTADGPRSCPVSRDVLRQSTRLSGARHGDPADRMLIATAQLLGVPLVTADKTIIRYAERHSGLHVIDVRRR